MRARDPAKAVQLLDLLVEFFADGALWLQGGFRDPDAASFVDVGALVGGAPDHILGG